MRTMPEMSDLFQPVEEAIRHNLLPALTGRTGLDDLEISFNYQKSPSTTSSPRRTGHYGPHKESDEPLPQLQANYSYPHQSYYPTKRTCSSNNSAEQATIKQQVKLARRKDLTDEARRLHEELPPKMPRAMDLGYEKGASSWLMTLPLKEHNFAFPKGSFCNALSLRYGWRPPHLPSHCVCGSTFSTEHAFSCPCSGLPSIRHNDVHDITAKLLTEVCPNVETEPALQPLTGEKLSHITSNQDTGTNIKVIFSDSVAFPYPLLK